MALVGESAAKFLDGDVRRLAEKGQDQALAGLDPTRAAVAAQCLRPGIALHLHTPFPPADARGADAKPFTGFPMRQAASNGLQNTAP